MSDKINNQENLSSASTIPSIRSFQIDPNGLGGISDSINLFRGEVNIPLNLLSVSDRSGLEASVTILYNNNVIKKTDTWNLEAPTGPVGLGWSMGFDFITLENNGTIADNNNNYYLIANGNVNKLFLTVQTNSYWEFELEQYQFWQIRYYLNEERWIIIKEDGSQHIFGGKGTDLSSAPIQYNIKWGGQSGNWTDSSSKTTGQVNYPDVWNLSRIQNSFGDGIDFYYQNDLRKIGSSSGLYYTQASRLIKIVAPYSRSLLFLYKNKKCDNTIREYQFPHVYNKPDSDFYAYQDRLETKYLDCIELRNSGNSITEPNELISYLKFHYEIVNISENNQNNPDFFKRYLTKIVMHTANGLELPNFQFSYYNDITTDKPDNIHKGAIKSIVYPQGGIVTYTYNKANLPGTNRTKVWVPQKKINRFWYGSDYTIHAEYDGLRQLDIKILSWNGCWVEAPQSFLLTEKIDLETLNVSTQQDFFALSFTSDSSSPKLNTILCHKEKGRFGQWIFEQCEVLYTSDNNQAFVVTGDQFVMALSSSGRFFLKSWNKRLQQWNNNNNEIAVPSNCRYALAATNDYLVLASHASNNQVRLSQYYFDKDQKFKAGSLYIKSIPKIIWVDKNTPGTFWAVGAGYFVTTYITDQTDKEITYKVQIQQWDKSFRASLKVDETYKLPKDTHLPFLQSIASDSIVGNLNHLFRYDGLQWIKSDLKFDDPESKIIYGSDLAIVSNKAENRIKLFNPYKLSWEDQIFKSTASENAPTISGRYISVGNQIMYRNNEGTLVNVYNLPYDLKPGSLSNRAPYFFAWEDNSGSSIILPLKNGTVTSPITLYNQKLYTDEKNPGTILVGVNSLVTYQGSFSNPSKMTLYQYVNDQIAGSIDAYPVSQLVIDNGYNVDWGEKKTIYAKTNYLYDTEHVTINNDGEITEFAAATTIYGSIDTDSLKNNYPSPENTLFGRSEFRFHNNASAISNGLMQDWYEKGKEPDYYYSYLNGMLFDQTDFDHEGNPVQRMINYYEVRTEYASTDNPGNLKPLIGGYVKTKATESTQYEDPLITEVNNAEKSIDRILANSVNNLFISRSIPLDHLKYKEAGVPGRWMIYPMKNKQTYYPVVATNDKITVAVGVTRTVHYEYSWDTGLMTADETENYTMEGHQEFFRREIYFAYQVPAYSQFKEKHIWSSVAASIRFHISNDKKTPVELSLTTYKRWAEDTEILSTWAPESTWIGISEKAYNPANSVPVNFNNWDAKSVHVDHWRRTGTTTKRGISGAVMEALDVMNKPTFMLNGKEDMYRIATFVNAFEFETAYLGFEKYEACSGWSLRKRDLEESLVEGDAHTGYRSLKLNADASDSLQKKIRISTNKIYILSCWIKTPGTFDADPGKAEWKITDNKENVLCTFEIKGTNRKWEYRHFVINIGGETESIDICLNTINGKQSGENYLLLDDILFNPLDSETSVSVYDTVYGDVLASFTPSGQVLRNGYDSYHAAQSQTINNKTSSLTSLFMPKQWVNNTDVCINKTYPNAITEIKASEGGTMVDLVQGEDWRLEWTGNNLPDWFTKDDTLFYKGNKQDAIQLICTENAHNYGVKVSFVQPVDEEGSPVMPSKETGLFIGNNLQVIWYPVTGWTMKLKNKQIRIPSPIPGTSGFGTEWILIVSEDLVSDKTSVYFMVDGLLLYSDLDSDPVQGAFGLILSEGGFGFKTITTFKDPYIAIEYLDGAAREIQKISLDGPDIIVQETVYDPIGRAAIATKSARLKNKAPLYQADFVQSFDPVTGIMKGEIADLNPDAEGFPYIRSVFKQTAQELVLKQGLPGKDYSVNSVNEKYNSIEYGTNISNQMQGVQWPANQYFITKVKNADKQETIMVTTKTGQEIVKMLGPDEDGNYVTTWVFYDKAQRVTKKMAPNGVLEIQQGKGSGEKWLTKYNYDFEGNLMSEDNPDSGINEFVYDLAGNIRFSLTAKNRKKGEEGKDIILYNKYDGRGRLIESGFFEDKWDRNTLNHLADSDPTYPFTTVKYTVLYTFEFDGDGLNAAHYGKLLRSSAFNDDGSLMAENDFYYDNDGNIIKKSMSAPGYSSDKWSLNYEYDNLGNLVKMEYPSGCPFPVITYRYNKLGQIYCMGDGEKPDALGIFTYNPDGAIIHSTMNIHDSLSIERQSVYNPAGWPLLTENTINSKLLLREEFSYNANGHQDAGYYDGKIAQVRYTEEDNSSYALKFRYDKLARILTAEHTADPSLSLGVVKPVSYDPNGNILSLSIGTDSATYNYEDNNNRLKKINYQSGHAGSFVHDPGGNIQQVSGDDKDITQIYYLKSGNRIKSIQIGATAKIGVPDSNLSLHYDACNSRVVKQLKDHSQNELCAKLYVRDEDTRSVFEETRSPDKSEKVQYLYGPEGLSGMIRGNKRYTLVKDHLGSVRKVVDETGAVVAGFSYTTFGITITKAGSKEPDIIFYRFTGQEFDPETGLYNFPARMYDPQTGRFYAVDPKQEGGTPYAYVLNNPSNLVDPDGEEALAAFLIAVVVGLVMGTVAGAITYAVTHSGSFNVGQFFLYATVGAVAGVVAGAAAWGGGALATAGLAAAGVSTSTSVASGVVVGTVSGGVGGAVGGSVNQIGVNLIEGKPVFEGVAMQAGIGAGIGAVMGGIAGGITAKLHSPVANKLNKPDVLIARNNTAKENFIGNKHFTGIGDINTALGNVTDNEVLRLRGHGPKTTARIRFSNNKGVNVVSAQDIANSLKKNGNFHARGIQVASCYAGRNGTARILANELNIPTLSSTGAVKVIRGGSVVSSHPILHPMRTYYPSKLKTGWVALFGY